MKNVDLVSKYVKTGTDCPFCGSDINAPILVGELKHHYNFKSDGPNSVRQLVKCPACGSKWVDTYKLADIIEVRDTKGKGY